MMVMVQVLPAATGAMLHRSLVIANGDGALSDEIVIGSAVIFLLCLPAFLTFTVFDFDAFRNTLPNFTIFGPIFSTPGTEVGVAVGVVVAVGVAVLVAVEVAVAVGVIVADAVADAVAVAVGVRDGVEVAVAVGVRDALAVAVAVGPATRSSFATNASLPVLEAFSAPPVVGKSPEVACPVTYAFCCESIAILMPRSLLVPPRYVE